MGWTAGFAGFAGFTDPRYKFLTVTILARGVGVNEPGKPGKPGRAQSGRVMGVKGFWWSAPDEGGRSAPIPWSHGRPDRKNSQSW